MRRENVGPAHASTQRLAAHGPRVPHRPRAGPGPGTPLAKFLRVFEGGFCLQKRDAAAAARVLCLTDADSLPDPRPHGDPPFSEEAAEARRGWTSSGPGVGAKPSAGRPARGSRCKRRAAARRSWSQGVQQLRQNATMGVACDHSVCVCGSQVWRPEVRDQGASLVGCGPPSRSQTSGSSEGSPGRALIPFRRPRPRGRSTSQRPHLPMPAPRRVDFKPCMWGSQAFSPRQASLLMLNDASWGTGKDLLLAQSS